MSTELYNTIVFIWNILYVGFAFISSLLTSIVSGIGLAVLIRKRKSISKFFNVFVNYSLQNTVSELDHKLNVLNLYDLSSSNTPDARDEVIGIFSEIIGQIDGNEFLSDKFEREKENILAYINDPESLNQARKRYLMSLIREKLKSITLKVYKDQAREEHE